MEDFKQIVFEQLPIKLTKFLDTLADEDLEQLEKVDKHLIARIYQAGAVFSIEILNELKEAAK